MKRQKSSPVGPAAARRRRLSPEVRRRQILQAAIKLFARRGYTRTSTREIAAEAGISEGTIFRYFAAKQDILFSFLESEALQSLDSLVAIAGESGDEQWIRAFLENRMTLGRKNEELFKVMVGEALFEPKLAESLVERIMKPASRLMEKFVAARMASGAFRHLNPTIVCRALIDHFFAYMIIWRGLAGKQMVQVDAGELVEGLTDLFLHGVAANRPQSPAIPPRGRGKSRGPRRR